MKPRLSASTTLPRRPLTDISRARPETQEFEDDVDPYATIGPNAFKGKSLPSHQDNTTREEISGAKPGKQKPEDVSDVYATVLPGAIRGKPPKGPVLSPPPSAGQLSPRPPELPHPLIKRATTPYEEVSPGSLTDSSPYEKLYSSSPRQSGKRAPTVFFGDDFKPIETVPPLPPRGTPPKAPRVVFGSNNVFNLTHSNYDNFIKDKEKALVIFYDGRKSSFEKFAKEFGHAADQTQNDNHCFGAVDCNFHRPLCCKEQIIHMPALKLYSNGFIVSSLMETSTFNANQLTQLVAMSPVLTQPRG